MEINKIYHGDCLNIIQNFPDNSVDTIITDPPYGYLKHKLDCYFDYQSWLKECYRVLKNNSCLIFFGRGTGAARWQCYAEDLGLTFKEEFIWYKKQSSCPLLNVMRVHECLWLFCKGKRKLNKVFIDKIPYDELTNPVATINDYKRILTGIKSINSYDDFVRFKEYSVNKLSASKHKITMRSNLKTQRREYKTFRSYQRGKLLSTLLVVQREHYNYRHPTQKPLELFKQLIKLISKEGNLVLDMFGGSGTTAIACLETNRNYIVIEKDDQYFSMIQDRIADWHDKPRQLDMKI